ncbi:hypothetical protein [Deinococcus cellulosilyticus]|uniref:Uncharacterized protein n=1 Tax=Deinococcus cellulosilyticus (strain DSM 18568 / NBRC 106333 / KACC 11606 / 5516J-15) TaxID=1223518 RepID=A0A511MVM4_DEIC1|nr:hypothetical protein [Deinococcus cellulosilyticus]GEM44639.1 hypothetical protein DC3_02740 [Deinococcus cellulosilyticus NBRC 106333 = KACC 11606]
MSRSLHPDALTTTLNSAQMLWEALQPELSSQTLQILLDTAQKQSEFALLNEAVFQKLPKNMLYALPIAEQYAFVLCRARKQSEYLGFLQRFSEHAQPSPALRAIEAWALLYNQKPENIEKALHLTQTLKGQVSGWFEGMRLRVTGEALSMLGHEGWEPFFMQARQHLTGPSLGICIMEQGSHHSRVKNVEQARTLWSEALPYLRHDAHYHAWLRYNLGITSMGLHTEEAERHFLELEQLRHRQEAKDFLASALRGLGSARRVLGELNRALSCYRQALKAAIEDEDREQALWGIGRTLIQAGQSFEGLAYLKEAHLVQESCWLHADMAIAHLRLQDWNGAEGAAARIDLNTGLRSAQVALLVFAELHRLRGEPEKAQVCLSRIDFSQWHLREDRRCFEGLFQFAEARGFPAVPVFPIREAYTVQVQAEGVLRVRVNGRPIPLKPSSKPAELLVRLLEKGGQDTLDSLQDALFRDEPTTRRKAGQALWNHVKRLRFLLGWEESILAPGGAFVLDPNANWDYDIAQARTEKRPIRGFLEGVYSEWVLETQQDLGAD